MLKITEPFPLLKKYKIYDKTLHYFIMDNKLKNLKDFIEDELKNSVGETFIKKLGDSYDDYIKELILLVKECCYLNLDKLFAKGKSKQLIDTISKLNYKYLTFLCEFENGSRSYILSNIPINKYIE